jgi:hypothetical protein
MGKIPYLFRRKNVFYFRLVIPTELRTRFNFPHITISLKTQNCDKAIPKALMLASNLKSYLHDVKCGLRAPYYNNERTHQGKICCGRTQMATLDDGKTAWKEKTFRLNLT